MDFKELLRERERRLFDTLSIELKSLGDDVVEQVRTHRVVYSREFSLRDFCEVTLRQRKLALSLISPPASGKSTRTLLIQSEDDIRMALPLIRDAYERV